MIDKNKNLDEYYTDQEKLINALSYLAKCDTYVFRGYNKQDQLLPVIIRDKDFSGVEAELLSEFEKYGSHYFTANTPIDLLSYGQHYGLPTRLLDFTYNPFIALSFALFTQKSPGKYKESEDKDYYYIRYCSLKDNICLRGIPASPESMFGTYKLDSISKKCVDLLEHYSKRLSNPDESLNDYINGLIECDYQSGDRKSNEFRKSYGIMIKQKLKLKRLCFIDPNQANQRIIMQQGLFMLPYTLTLDEHLQTIYDNTSVIKIHRDMRDSLLKYLDTLGYNTFRLTPDLPSICSAVTQKVKEMRAAQSTLFKKIKTASDDE